MPRYSFYQDTKVETWERSHFDVMANSYEEAVAIVKAFKDSDVDNHQDEEYIEFGIFESIYETSQKIEPLPGASPTIMIFNEDTGMPVVDNRKPAENNCPNDKEHAIPESCDFETDIRSLRNSILTAIKNIFLQSGFSRIELTSATEEVQVVWWDNHRYTHESPVEAICFDGGELSLQLSDEDGESITLWEDSDFAFEHPAWLNGILNSLKEATEQS